MTYTDLTAKIEAVQILRRVVPKAEMDNAGLELANRLMDTQSALSAFVKLKNAVEVLEAAMAQVKELAITDVPADAKPSKPVEMFGAKVSLKALPKKYDYHNDTKLAILEAKAKQAKDAADAHRKLLQTIKQPLPDPETGETLLPATVTSDGVTIQVEF